MKQCICYFITISLFIPCISCKKDFLNNVNNKSVLLRQDYVIDLKTTEEFLYGIYVRLSSYLYTSYQVIYPDVIADNIKPVTSSSSTNIPPLLIHYKWAQMADGSAALSNLGTKAPNCNGTSYTSNQLVLSCNFVLEKATEYRDQDPVKAAVVIGQALAIRALVYFSLVNIFAQPYQFTADGAHPGVVLVLSSDWTAPAKRRNTVSEVYNQMVTDLTEAIQLLPTATTSTYLMNRNAAKALLARVFLFKGDYAAAKQFATEVCRDVPMMVANYPSKLFTPEDSEALFQLPPGTSVNGYVTTFANYHFRSQIAFMATPDIAQLLTEDPNDQRKAWVMSSSGNWNITKYPSGVVADPAIDDPAKAYNQSVIRSSEMFLTAAECYAQLHNEDSARFYLHAIQSRANAALTDPSITGTALLDAIYKERRKELAFEGLRMFDLLRWKKGVSRIGETDPTIKELPFPSPRAIAPIPGLDVTVLGLSQNEGY